MSRQYPHSDTIQPRFAAWLWACGSDIAPQTIGALAQGWQRQFIAWVGACVREAHQRDMGVRKLDLSRYYGEPQFQVADQDEFTEACWVIADEQRPFNHEGITHGLR